LPGPDAGLPHVDAQIAAGRHWCAHGRDGNSQKIQVELLATIVFSVIGGLGLFLLGMKNMSDGLQAIAGRRLRAMISAVTNNRMTAIAVGTGVTCLIQSNSITTVMVVGFVNAGFMTLAQAIGVIMGANIGTTITG